MSFAATVPGPDAARLGETLPPAEVVAWAAALLRQAPPTADARPNVTFLMGEATRSGVLGPLNPRMTVTIPGEKAPRDVAVEAHLSTGLLLRTATGWRTFVSYVDLYAAHALVAAPRALGERVGALRTAIVAVQRRTEGRPC